MIIRLLMAIVLLFSPAAALAESIYKHTDEKGVIVFSDVPEKKSARIVSKPGKTALGSASRTSHRKKYSRNYDLIIDSKADKYRIDPSLIKAVIKVESGFRESAVSRKGALGLMQLMPATARAMGVYNPMNPESNIEGGTRYLKYLLERFGGDLKLALAAYNAGPKRVEKYGDVPPIKETMSYVKKVFSLYGKEWHELPASKAIYRIVLKDGTTIFTDTTFHGKQ